ncbi:hypothetical protein GCM10027059_06940 [Myceligenerans halotolerans]
MTDDRAAQSGGPVQRIVFLGGLALAAGGVWAILQGNVFLGVALLVAAGIMVLARGIWVTRRGLKAVSEREKAQVPEPAGGSPAAPTPVDRVVADLLSMNSDGLPYLVEASRKAGGVRVDVRWKVEEVRWQTLFVRGKRAYAWRMEVDLDPATGQYKFVEYSGSASVRSALSPGGGFIHASWK